MNSNDPAGDLIRNAVPAFRGATPELLRRDMLEFVYEEVRVPGRFREHKQTAIVEQRIFDEAGTWVGRVEELPPASKPTLERGGHLDKPVGAAMYDSKDAKILEFSGSWGVRRSRLFGRSRRLDVVDGAGRPVGTLVVGAFRFRGTLSTLYGRSSERIGDTKEKAFFGGVAFSWVDCAIHNSRGRRSAGSRTAKRTPDDSDVKTSWSRRAA